jgi:hypothetical protein
MEWSAFLVDLMLVVTIPFSLFAAAVLFWYGHPWPALFCFAPVALSAWSIRYRFQIAHYFLGGRR